MGMEEYDGAGKAWERGPGEFDGDSCWAVGVGL